MKRDHASLAGILGLSLLLLGGASFAAGQDDLPKDADKLFTHAQDKMNQGLWQEAERAFKAYIEKHPDGKQLEAAYQQMASLNHWHSHRYVAAREWYAKLCEKFPKSPNYWNNRIQMASLYQSENNQAKAIEELRKISKEATDANIRTRAVQQIWNIQGKYFTMNVNQSFTAGQEPVVQVSLSKVDKVVYRAVHIKYDALLEPLAADDTGDLHQAVGKVKKSGRKLLKEWTAEYPSDQQWRTEQVKVPSTESGVYIVEGEHDGITMSVTLFVSKYGLITKFAAGKLVCFAQDRATSKPVEGMSVKALNKEHPLKGTTDANGLFVTDGYKGGVIIGMKDGDVVSTQTYYNSQQQEDHPVVYVVTDRPIYRPNQTVQFRVIHRNEKGQKLEVKAGEKLTVEIHDPKNNKVYEQKHALNEFGSASGEFVLGDEPSLGEYSIFVRPEKTDPNYNEHYWRWGGYYYGSGCPQNFGRFRVDEYRKPEYKVDVEFKQSPVIQGETVDGTIKAQYYFGSPVADAEVTYTIYRRPHWSWWRCWAYYYDWYVDENEESYGWGEKCGRRGGWWGYGEEVFQGHGRTDKEGKLAVQFASQKWDYDATYTVHAKVTDLSRRMVEGEGNCKATRAEFGLQMTLNKYVYKPGERINAKVRAATADDTVVKETKITIRAYDRHWMNNAWQDNPLFEGEAKTDDHGIAEFNVTPELQGGYIYLVAEAHDKKGNRVSSEHWAWMYGDNWYGDNVNLNGIDLVLDKKTYSMGDTAQILVTSQFKNVTLLFTVEGKELHRCQVVAVKGHTKMIEFKIDDPAFAPNVFVSVMAIKENQIVQKQRMLIVNPSEKFVTVEITPDQSQYRPRQKARYEVVTRGADGKPVSSEVSLGIVDDSIYALQDEYAQDIRKHFIYKKWIQVATSTSLHYYDSGRAQTKEENKKMDSRGEGLAAPDPTAAGQGFGFESRDAAKKTQGDRTVSYAATEVRSKFADTMLWKTVVTDAQGRATVDVEIPDNLTTWRATARAVTADSRFGQEVNSVVARKNVIVRLETPRFFTQNDETVISAIAHNYLSNEKEVKIEFAAEGIDVKGDNEMIVKIAPHGQKRIDWKATIRNAGKAKITVKALTDEDSDAMQLVVPVQAHGTLKWDSKTGFVTDKVVEKIRVPAEAVKNAAELVVVVSPTHASMVLDALDYLAGYPYGCVEQTMSRFLPTVIVSQALEKLGIDKPELKKEVPAMVAQGLQRLYNFQQQDGGWGWWQYDQSNSWTTAYVVFGLALARDADHPVEKQVLDRGIAALQAHLAKATEANEQAYLLYALSAAGGRNDVVRSALTDRLGELSGYAKALLALVLHKDGRDAREAVETLAKDLKGVGASAYLEGQPHGRWLDHPVDATAMALRAFLRVDPKNPAVPKMVHWLSTQRQGNYWGSTRPTAMAVFALTDYMAVSGDVNPDMNIRLSFNGGQVLSERVTRANWQKFDGIRKFTAAQLGDGDNEIVIEKTGTGTPIYSIFLKYYAQAEDLQPSTGGIQIDRRYSRVIYQNGKRELEPLDSGATVASGDEIEVTLTLSSDAHYEWLMLEDPFPSGFEPVREYWGYYGWCWNYWYSRKEFHDDRVSIAMTHLWNGTHAASYVIRAETPGRFHALPARAFNMYHPEIGGNSSEFRIAVKDLIK